MDNDTPVAAPPQLPASPWEADIRAHFVDPAQQIAVDNFMRARVQPRMTQLEQQYAETQQARDLLDSFGKDPVGTFNDVRNQLIELGYPVGEATQMAQAAKDDAAAQNAAAAAAPPAPAGPTPLDPRVEAMLADYEERRQLETYDQQIAQIVNDPRNADINPNRYHLYVSATGGDFEQALDLYRADVAQILTDYGIDPSQSTAAQADAASQLATQGASAAPPVMGAGAGGAGSTMPTQADYRAQGMSPQEALHKSIEDAAANMLRPGGAPPIA
jgi:hypothetical protein